MITIKVNNRNLYIPQDTSLVLEQHNNSFDIDNIGADIIWTFDVPAAPNAIALNNAQYVCVSNYKRYRCEVGFNGATIASGDLYVQGVTDEKSISCGIILDGLGEHFGQRMMKDNDYGDDIIISQPTDSLDRHRENWLEFLRNSFNEESVYKFFLFSSEQFYKNNEAYGYHNNQPMALNGENDDKLWTKYVNRLLFWRLANYQSAPIGLPNNAVFNERIFNTLGNNNDKLNGYAFAPAIRLDWLVKKVFANAGYHVTGDFLTNKYIKRLFLQSMNAMDGDMTQFGLNEYIYINGVVGTNEIAETDTSFLVGVNEVSFKGFKTGTRTPTFNFRLNADVDSLQHTELTTGFFTHEDEVFLLFVRPQSWDGQYPKLRSVVNHNAAKKDYRYGKLQPSWMTLGNAAGAVGYGSFTNGSMSPCERLVMLDNGRFDGLDRLGNACHNADFFYGLEPCYTFIQLTPSSENPGANYEGEGADIDGNFTAGAFYQNAARTTSEKYMVELVKMKVRTPRHFVFNDENSTTDVALNLQQIHDGAGGSVNAPIFIQYEGQLEWLEYIETIDARPIAATDTMLNVFDTMLRWRQHVPNVSNADFIKNICRFFGLSLYVNPFQKEVQLSFVNNVFEADAIDITEYVTGYKRLAYEPKQYKVGVDTVLGKKSVADDFLLPAVACRNDLITPRSRKRMSAFVENENAYNHSTLDSDSGKYIWATSAGNDRKLVTGNNADDVEELTTGIAVPNMRVVDVAGVARRVCDIPTSGNSKLMDDDYTGEFGMILQQYKGQRFANVHLNSTLGFCELADPTSLDENGQTDSGDFIDLTTSGPKSVGELWLRRFYEFMSNHENYQFTAMLPLNVFLQVYRTQQPQHVAVCHEKRWIMVKNRKYLPMSITYEFGREDTVLATIECARLHYE